MNIKNEISLILSNALVKAGFNVSGNLVSFSNKPEVADFQSNVCFSLSKENNLAPQIIAEKILKEINSKDFEFSFCAPGFINIKLSDKKLSKIASELLSDENLGVEKDQKSEVVFLDYGGANVAKELHMGHLRSPIIGESIKRLYNLFGHKTISDTHLGDWGLQMGLTIAQLEDDGYLDYYFKGTGTKPTITLDMLNEEYPKASLRKKTDEAFKEKADNYTLWLQQRKEPYLSVWKDMRAVSVKTIEKNYKTLGMTFDLWEGESSATSEQIEETINIFKDKGLTRISDGALVVDVALPGENIPIPKKNPDDPQLYRNPMPPAIIKKHNGGELYMTTDLTCLRERNLKYNPDKIIYITDNRQKEHFIKVFRCAKMAGISPEGQELIHVAFGTMNGKDGKPFKTRSGETIKLEDVIDLISAKAQEKLTANGLGTNKKLALDIGIAALKFGDLSNDVGKDYVLDIDRFSAFEGKTGPYLQYTVARINSLLAKAGDVSGEIEIKTSEEKVIVMNLLKLVESFRISLENLSLVSLTSAVFALAQSYSTLYNNIRILSEPNLKRKASLVKISALVRKAIALALDVLAINAPEKM